MSLEEADLFCPIAPKSRQPNQFTVPSPAVVTGISAGRDGRDGEGIGATIENTELTDSGEEIDRPNAIYKTVRMEHTYC